MVESMGNDEGGVFFTHKSENGLTVLKNNMSLMYNHTNFNEQQ